MADFLQNSALWGVVLTLGAFAVGTALNRLTGKAWCNPLLLASLFVILFLSLMNVPYVDYKASSAPISLLLTPATVSLAIPLYENWELLKRNWRAIFSGILAGTVTSLLCVVAITCVFHLDQAAFATLLPKSVTTAIGADIAETLGGMAALAGTVIIFTGIMGNLAAVGLCRVCHITSPIAKGVAIGTSSHAIGTVKALEIGEIEGATSGLAIAIAGILTAVLSPIATNLFP